MLGSSDLERIHIDREYLHNELNFRLPNYEASALITRQLTQHLLLQ